MAEKTEKCGERRLELQSVEQGACGVDGMSLKQDQISHKIQDSGPCVLTPIQSVEQGPCDVDGMSLKHD